MQTWMCKHDLGLVEVGMTDFFNDFDRFSDSSVVSQGFDRLSCLKVIFLGIWLIFLFGSDFPKIVIGFLISILFFYLLGFPISIFVFYETSTCRHGCANMTWDLWRSE